MSNININKRNYSGQNIIVKNGKVIVDGKDVTPENETVISISVEGNIDSINADECSTITINGNAESVKSMSGDIKVSGAVSGSVSTMSGDVRAGSIGGSVSTMSGDITTK